MNLTRSINSRRMFEGRPEMEVFRWNGEKWGEPVSSKRGLRRWLKDIRWHTPCSRIEVRPPHIKMQPETDDDVKAVYHLGTGTCVANGCQGRELEVIGFRQEDGTIALGIASFQVIHNAMVTSPTAEEPSATATTLIAATV